MVTVESADGLEKGPGRSGIRRATLLSRVKGLFTPLKQPEPTVPDDLSSKSVMRGELAPSPNPAMETEKFDPTNHLYGRFAESMARQLQVFGKPSVTLVSPDFDIQIKLLEEFKKFDPQTNLATASMEVLKSKALAFLEDEGQRASRLLLANKLATWEQMTLQMATGITMKESRQVKAARGNPLEIQMVFDASSGMLAFDSSTPALGFIGGADRLIRKLVNGKLSAPVATALSGGLVGAGAGSFMPVIGTGIGGAIGALVGGVIGLGYGQSERAQTIHQDVMSDHTNLARARQLEAMRIARSTKYSFSLPTEAFDGNKNTLDMNRTRLEPAQIAFIYGMYGTRDRMQSDEVSQAILRIGALASARGELQVGAGRDPRDVQVNLVQRGLLGLGPYSYVDRQPTRLHGDKAVGANIYEQVFHELTDTDGILAELKKTNDHELTKKRDKAAGELATTQAKARLLSAKGEKSALSESEKERLTKSKKAEIDKAKAKLEVVSKTDRDLAESITKATTDSTALEAAILAKWHTRFGAASTIVDIKKLDGYANQTDSIKWAQDDLEKKTSYLTALTTEKSLVNDSIQILAKAKAPIPGHYLTRLTQLDTAIGNTASGATKDRDDARRVCSHREAQWSFISNDIQKYDALEAEIQDNTSKRDSARSLHAILPASLPLLLGPAYDTAQTTMIQNTEKELSAREHELTTIGIDPWQPRKVEQYELTIKHIFGGDPVTGEVTAAAEAHEKIQERARKLDAADPLTELPFDHDAKYHDVVEYPKFYLRTLQVMFGEDLLLASGKDTFAAVTKLLTPEKMQSLVAYHVGHGNVPPLPAGVQAALTAADLYSAGSLLRTTLSESDVTHSLITILEKGLAREATYGNLYDQTAQLRVAIETVDRATGYTPAFNTIDRSAIISHIAKHYYSFTDEKDLAERIWNDAVVAAGYASHFATPPSTTDAVEQKLCARFYAKEAIAIHKKEMSR